MPMLDGMSQIPAPEPLPPYADPSSVVAVAAAAVRPPRRVDVAEAAAKYRRLNNPGGGYSGW